MLDFAPVFKNRHLADLAVRELTAVHKKHQARLHAFVMMPEHFHFVTTLSETQNSIAFVDRLKTRIAETILRELTPDEKSLFDMQRGLNRRQFWRPSFRGFKVEGEEMFWQKVGYTHLNPVRRGLVLYAEEYRWSSAKLYLGGHWSETEGVPFKMDDLPE